MAIGIAKTLGFDLINNFNRPYFASSITEFWKRWHISLTRWLTTHVYINLGGNRCSKLRQYLNILITFFVSGLWHGANWTFVVWGAIHGFLQVIEKALAIDPKGHYYVTVEKYVWLRPFRILLTFMLVNFAWIFFRLPSLDDACSVISQIFVSTEAQPLLFKMGNTDKVLTFIALCVFLLNEVLSEYAQKCRLMDSKPLRWLAYITIFVLIVMIGVLDAGSFIYVSF